MNQPSYSYNRQYATRYTFVSKGRKGVITKVVEFTPTSIKNILNLGFGDLLTDGSIDDKANTNNNDIIKVLATVVQIIQDFTAEYPAIKIVFTGSTSARTSLYHRILKIYYPAFSKGFMITALIKDKNEFTECMFDPDTNEKYLAFFVKRKL